MIEAIQRKIDNLTQRMNTYEYELDLIKPATFENIHKVDSYVKHIDRLYWQIQILNELKKELNK